NTNLKWQLTVTDDEGGVSASQFDMTLNKTAQVIIADAGANQTVEEFDKVILDATASEAATQSYQCMWQQLTGNAETLIEPKSCTASFFASDIDLNATLSFEVQVMDLKGRTDTDTVFIDVTPKALDR
ncbi:PKD domain-containing protein, partial [Pseudoalteromonas rubra]|uniref:PKD domain-containing protein n=1 Tax=Pseudoalteromonas rubra TaxID=43658 RepID=UPI0012843973